MQQSRRNFIVKGCSGCLGILGMGTLLQGCTSSAGALYKTTVQNQQLLVPIDKWVAGKNTLLVRAPQLEYDILLVKKEQGYNALYLECTHEGIALSPTKDKIVCPAHGSEFDFEGNVKKEPALRPLKKYKAESTAAGIVIHLS